LFLLFLLLLRLVALQADEFEKTPLLDDSMATQQGGSSVQGGSKPARVNSLDTFRGISLFFMIFVNYGGDYFYICSILLHSLWPALCYMHCHNLIYSFEPATCIIVMLLSTH
jgi:hypothetical protein